MILLVLFYILFPAVILFYTEKYPALNKIGAVLIAYFFGLVLGSSGILPNEIEGLQEQVSRVSVLPAIPLFLFPADIRPWLKVAGKTM